MTHLEMVEKLRSIAGLGYEEAKDLLERSNWDLLDAMVILEREGKAQGGSYTTFEGETPKKEKANSHKSGSFKSALRWLWDVVKKSCNNNIEVVHNGERVMGLPILVFIILLCACFWVLVPVMLIALLFGVRFRFAGPDVDHGELNDLKDKVVSKIDEVLNSDEENE